MPLALKAEQLDIEAEKRSILANLRTGDLKKQLLACDRISTLAENYFPEFLLRSVNLISDANRLDDLIRERRISADQQGVEVHQLIATAVNLLTEMTQATPTGAVALEQMGAAERASNEVKAETIANEISNKSHSEGPTQDHEEANDDSLLLNFIVEAREPQSQGKLIVAQDITKNYPGSSFKLRPISLELKRGEILGIVGVNASGKTTLLRILLGDIKQSAGDLAYPSLGEDSKRPDWIRIKRRIGYVSQTLPRWPGRVHDNLCYVASIFGHHLNEIEAFIDLLLKRYGLDKFKDATWDEISGGYKTRFEIVRALLGKPDVLILDEPLAYLDILSQQVVLRQLKQLARNRARPMGVIVTSQQLYEIEAVADRLLVLDGGATLFSDRIGNLSKLIDELVVEFSSSGQMMQIKAALASNRHFLSLFATETGYITVFRRGIPSAGELGRDTIHFNDVVKLLTLESPGVLSYARDISNSCRVLFEPRMVEWLNTPRSSR